MTMTYVRTYKITYDEKLSDSVRTSLNTKLWVNGLKSVGAFSTDLDDDKYGTQTEVIESTSYIVNMMGIEDMLTFAYSSDASKAQLELQKAFPDEEVELIDETVTTRKEVEMNLRGEYLIWDNYNHELSYMPHNKLGDSRVEDVRVMTKFSPSWRKTHLQFVITWTTDKIANKTDIEKNCVDAPLELMAYVQATVERLLLECGFDSRTIDDAMIDCHFDAKSESRSECTPDILAKVREAKRKVMESEEE